MKNAISLLTSLICKPVKVAAMTFNHEYHLEFCFDCFDNDCTGRQETHDALQAMVYRAGWTHTAGATQCACNVLLSASCGLPSHAACIDVVYITDGKSNDPHSLNVCNEVRCLHNRFGVNTHAIGIGNYNEKELQCIASASNYYSIFRFSTFDKFIEAIDNVILRLAKPPPGAQPGQYQCLDPQDDYGPGGQSSCS